MIQTYIEEKQQVSQQAYVHKGDACTMLDN